jgi:glycosyltransferase involved in cell wall biosynthesis
MRILIATSPRAIVGGVETYIRAVIPLLRARGHEVAVLCEWQAGPKNPTIDSEAPGIPVWVADELGPARALREACDWSPNVAYVHGLGAPELESALLKTLPTVLFAHNYHGTCVSGTKRHAFPTPQPCCRTFGLACLALYYPRRCGGLSPTTMLRHYRHQSLRKSLLPAYRAVLVASHHMRDEYLRHEVPKERVHLVPLFPPDQEPDPAPPARPRGNRVLLVGRLTELKGGRFLLEAVAQAWAALGRPLEVVVAGDGPERPALEKLARRLGVRAEFVGWVDPNRREELMREADVLAVPSVWPEPFGLVGIEAGCVGLPSVGFAVGGIPDWLRPGESGELAPGDPPTVGGLAAALVRALSDPTHLARLGEGAWRVSQQFTRAAHLDRLEPLLDRATRTA